MLPLSRVPVQAVPTSGFRDPPAFELFSVSLYSCIFGTRLYRHFSPQGTGTGTTIFILGGGSLYKELYYSILYNTVAQNLILIIKAPPLSLGAQVAQAICSAFRGTSRVAHNLFSKVLGF